MWYTLESDLPWLSRRRPAASRWRHPHERFGSEVVVRRLPATSISVPHSQTHFQRLYRDGPSTSATTVRRPKTLPARLRRFALFLISTLPLV